MPYDDEYWLQGYGGAQKQPVAPRSLPEATDAIARAKKTAVSSKVSPLLEAWLKERGLTVK